MIHELERVPTARLGRAIRDSYQRLQLQLHRMPGRATADDVRTCAAKYGHVLQESYR